MRPLLPLALAGVLLACDHEPELAVARASLHDDVPALPATLAPSVATGPVPWPPPAAPAPAVDPLQERLEREITPRNALQKARDLESVLDREVDTLQAQAEELEGEEGE